MTILLECLQPLRKLGDEYLCHCPFPEHVDTHPSFYYNEAKGVFHCFACDRGGSAKELAKFFDVKLNRSEKLKLVKRKLTSPAKSHISLAVGEGLLLALYKRFEELREKFPRWEVEAAYQAFLGEFEYMCDLISALEIEAVELAAWTMSLERDRFALEQRCKTGGLRNEVQED